ncbi:aminomethyltransferase folate-binding domain-containing protein [Phthorimaea operculella]|nr:aminomethyltransferase folate-binding domain-containing protein [Phthorimaea operculella]
MKIFNYFVAAGMKTVGISAAGGVAMSTADEIVDNYTKHDVYELHINRFLGLHNNKRFLRDRVKEAPGIHYGLPYPFMEFKTGRKLRMSPIFPSLRDNGAVFGQVMGYERPTWFDPVDKSRGTPQELPFRVAYTNTFGKPHWFDTVQREYWVCREAVGLADYSSFTKIDLQSQGREVVDTLQYLCSNDVDVPVGSIIHTGMQNERGGYENDCSLARITENQHAEPLQPGSRRTSEYTREPGTWSPTMWMTSIIHTGMQNHCSQDHREPVSTPGYQDTWSPTMWMTSIIHTGMQNHCSQDQNQHAEPLQPGSEPVSTPGYQDTWSPTMWMTSIIHTGMQNERGGYENDCSLARITENQ